MHIKKLMEERASLGAEMQELLKNANAEERALTTEEQEKFNEIENKIKDIDATIAAEKRARDLTITEPGDPGKEKEPTEEQRAESEARAFANYIRGYVAENRASGDKTDVNLTTTANGAIVPASIARRIIEKVVDICPIYQMAEKYNVGGTLSIPYYDESEGSIEMAYATEFEELTSTSAKFRSIELKGYLAGALSKISKSLVNNSDFELVNYTVNKMAEAISKWLEHEFLVGTTNKIDGISKATQVVETAASTAITGDDLIDLQEQIPDVYQTNCVWIMNKATRTAIRKLKDSDGNYLLNKDVTAKWGYTLLGNPVYCSDSMPKTLEAGVKSVVYGDMTGLAAKVTEDMNIEVLREKYATQHAIGIVGWMEVDAKIQNQQKIAVLKQKA